MLGPGANAEDKQTDVTPPNNATHAQGSGGITTTNHGAKRRRVGGAAAGGAAHRRTTQQATINAPVSESLIISSSFTLTVRRSTASLQTAGKKNVVLSGDAMKEMARQAKAMREDRRAGLDARHKWIISKVR